MQTSRPSREEFELVLDILRREQGTVIQLADILGAVDDPQMAFMVEEAGITRMHPVVAGLGLARRLFILVITDEDARRAV